jgi:amidohydrolase
MNTFLDEAKAIFDYTRDLRRDFHRYPELGLQEERTAAIIVRELNLHGYEVTTGVGVTGVVGVLDTGREGPVVLMRFDMDALPIQEETGAPYASTVNGVMHACGHDGHMAVGLTVARLTAKHAASLNGKVKFMFQPAEEGLGGAMRMITDGVLDNPKPDVALALHLWNARPVGWFGIPEGPLMAGADVFTVRVKGRGGHGALPDETIDPVHAAAQMVTALQSIVSRNLPPLSAGVVSVTQIHAGEAFNIIPAEATFKGTIRTFDSETKEKIHRRLQQIIEGIAGALDCEAEILIENGTPPVTNNRKIARRVVRACRLTVADAHIDHDARTMVSEDMALVLEEIPGCYFLVGSANASKNLNYAHHHPKFDFDEDALPIGAALMTAAAIDLLSNGVNHEPGDG